MKNRKRNRKKGFDYTSNNIYFITICCKYRIHHFGKIDNNQMDMNVFGEIVEDRITWLENQYPYVEMHNSVVMPNHIHLLFEINAQNILHQRTGHDLSLQLGGSSETWFGEPYQYRKRQETFFLNSRSIETCRNKKKIKEIINDSQI